MKKIQFLFFAVLYLGIGIAKAQYTVLLNFDSAKGISPAGNLTFIGHKFYGMANGGGAYNDGCVFSIDTDGTGYKDLLDFKGINGSHPNGSLLLSGGTLYGMTNTGGKYAFYGCVFSIDTDGSGYTDIHDFNYDIVNGNGEEPMGSLTISGNKLFGMTQYGGRQGYGSIFSINLNGSNYKDLFDFNNTNGGLPSGSLLIEGDKMFGMTSRGGAYSDGCAFSIDTSGNNYKDLLDFNGTNGQYPNGDLTLTGNKLFGMTSGGGIHAMGCIFSIDSDGNGYKDLTDFMNSNGENPDGTLNLIGNVLYGMVQGGGAYHYGCIFSLDSNGSNFTDIIDFNDINNPLGGYPYGSLTFVGPTMYGMARLGGTKNMGVIFKLDTANLTTSINKITASNFINIFPNPSTGIFTFQSNSEELKGKSVEVFNVLGERVLKQILRSAQDDKVINLNNQPNGVYFYRIIAEDGGLIGEGKLVIQK